MKKVITYGTYDLLHRGHIRLLQRAKALGDYLIVGVTADDFDKKRGKINVQQSLMERIEGVRATGLADEIIVEEYEGQKIDDVRKYDVDVFTVGSDWAGKFDYLKDYCDVVYLDRTEGVSSSEIRAKKAGVRLGLAGNSSVLLKYARESGFVNGISLAGICTRRQELTAQLEIPRLPYDELLDVCDGVYVNAPPQEHTAYIRTALQRGKHVIYEAPLAMDRATAQELLDLARERGCILMEAVKTAYATAYARLLLLAKTGAIGDIYSVDSVCTSLNTDNDSDQSSLYAWGPTALLPVFQLLGTEYAGCRMAVHTDEDGKDLFCRLSLEYPHAVATAKVGIGVKSEGELVISGTKGCIYVPAPWWKTDYFEIRCENSNDNKKYFYQLDGEGIRYELVAFVKAIENGRLLSNITREETLKLCQVMEDFCKKENLWQL